MIYSILYLLFFPFGFIPIYGKITDTEVDMKFADLGQDDKFWAKTIDQAFINGVSMDIICKNIYEMQAQYIGDSAIEILNLEYTYFRKASYKSLQIAS